MAKCFSELQLYRQLSSLQVLGPRSHQILFLRGLLLNCTTLLHKGFTEAAQRTSSGKTSPVIRELGHYRRSMWPCLSSSILFIMYPLPCCIMLREDVLNVSRWNVYIFCNSGLTGIIELVSRLTPILVSDDGGHVISSSNFWESVTTEMLYWST